MWPEPGFQEDRMRAPAGPGWLCKPSRHSQPHPTTSFLLEPHLPLLTFLTAILSFENAIWGQYKIHTMMTGGSSRKSFHTVHSNFN